MYNEELNYHSLTNEIDMLKVILNGNIVECFDDILKCVKGQQHQLMMMPNIVNLLRLLLVNPATSETAERSFSLPFPSCTDFTIGTAKSGLFTKSYYVAYLV